MEEGTKTQRGQIDIIVVRHFGLKFFEAFGVFLIGLRRAFWPGKNHKYFMKRNLHMEY